LTRTSVNQYSVLKVRSSLSSSSVTACISYHRMKFLSITFLNFFFEIHEALARFPVSCVIVGRLPHR
ncbi:hypothetical protein, partial [Acidaminococcus intestini]|uniref:hypothetical protein n=1 Tax=Acidaminococcus intestini TaxID=187327 RepID=UPI0022E40FDB